MGNYVLTYVCVVDTALRDKLTQGNEILAAANVALYILWPLK